MRECKDCGQAFSPFVHNQTRCRPCVDNRQRFEGNHKKILKKKFHKDCEWCGKHYEMTGPASRYCSDGCRASNKHAGVYGLTKEEYESFINKTTCDICDSEGFALNPSYDKNFVIDHCHSTGKVRGWLCHNCNRALGLFQDKIENLEKAIDYLKSAETIRKE